jgi:hypothetical protein
MTRTILHIGQPKTGTTSLQYSLSSMRKSLQAQNILYPRLPRWNFAHHSLVPHFIGSDRAGPYVLRKLKINFNSAVMESEKAREILKEQVIGKQPETLILSSEALFHAADEEKMKRLGKLLRSISNQVEIVAYIRDPASHALSTLSNQVQVDPDFVWPGNRIRRAVIESYEKAEPDAMHVIKFKREELQNANVVDDFCGRFLPPSLRLNSRQEANKSMSAEAMSVMQRYVLNNDSSRNKPMSINQQIFRRILVKVDQRVSGYSKPKFLPDIETAFLHSCSDLDWLKRKYGVDWAPVEPMYRTDHPTIGYGRKQKIRDLCVFDQVREEKIRKYMRFIAPK